MKIGAVGGPVKPVRPHCFEIRFQISLVPGLQFQPMTEPFTFGSLVEPNQEHPLVQQASLQRVPVSGKSPLPGFFLGPAQVHGCSAKPFCQAPVSCFLIPCFSKVAIAHREAHVVMAEGDPACRFEQRFIQRMADGGPGCRDQTVDPLDFPLRQAGTAGPQGFHGSAHGVRPAVLLHPLQHPLKQVIHSLAGQVSIQAGLQLLVHAEHPEFLGQGAQK